MGTSRPWGPCHATDHYRNALRPGGHPACDHFRRPVRTPTAARPVPVWSSLAISLFVVGMTSNTIAEDHRGAPGADILAFGGPLLLGMGVMAALMLFNQRRARIERRGSE